MTKYPAGRVRMALMAGLAVMAGACTPHVQGALPTPEAFEGPRLDLSDPQMGLGHFVVQDGARLPFRRWPVQGEPRAVIIALHGFNDTSAAWRLAGPWWAERGIEVWAYDQRGFGMAPHKGVWADPDVSREDLRTVTALIRAHRPHDPIAIMGESMGGALAISTFSSQRPPAADRLILLAPAVWGWSSQRPANRVAMWAAARALGERSVEAPAFAVRHIRASDNAVELIRNGRDPNFILKTRFDALHGLVDLMEDGAVGLGQVRVPTLLAYGANDQIVPRRAMRMALENAGANTSLMTAYYPHGWHILNRDLNAEILYEDVEAWLDGRNLPSAPQGVLSVLNADN